jgi:hypothetical protein
MAKPKGKAEAEEPEKERMHIYVSKAFLERLDAFCKSHRYGAPRGSVVEGAMTELMDREEKKK